MPTLTPTIDGYALWHRLQDNGGYTADPDSGDIPADGYAVSLPGFERRYGPGDCRPADVVSGLQDARQAQLIYPAWRVYAGAWRDEDGTTYLDASIVVDGVEEAEFLATEFEQIAYYDIANQASVYTQPASLPAA